MTTNQPTTTTQQKVTMRDYASPIAPTWCPGCGDFAIWTAIKMALVEKQIAPNEVVLCFDIGCNGNMADKITANVFKGLHGRAIPLAIGTHLGNPKLPVIAIAGDGGVFDEGINHLIHAIRSNYNITLILHNNCDFGLTTGQATPTTPRGQKMNSSPNGVVEDRLNPLQLVLGLNASFVARGFTGDQTQIKELIGKAMDHKGFSYLEIIQHCPTYNKFLDQTWFKDRVYKLDKPVSSKEAIELVDYSQEQVATGILHQDIENPSYLDRVEYNPEDPSIADISGFLKRFR